MNRQTQYILCGVGHVAVLLYGYRPYIAQYIKVDSYLSITRRCGFYGDPNFYTAHITAAIAGCLVLVADGQRRARTAVLLVLAAVLVYCGFLSGSKSFFLIWVFLMILWVIEICQTKGKLTRKAALILGLLVFLVYVASSSLFRDKINVILTRFSCIGIILPIELLPAAVAEVQVFPVENQFTVRAHWIASKSADKAAFLNRYRQLGIRAAGSSAARSV